MNITVTAREIIDSGHWDDFCEKNGYNIWCINEGLMDSSEEFILTVEEAKKYGFIKNK